MLDDDDERVMDQRQEVIDRLQKILDACWDGAMDGSASACDIAVKVLAVQAQLLGLGPRAW